MAERWPHLKRAPIVEATIDFRVSPSPTASLEILDRISPSLVNKYDQKKNRLKIEGQFSFGQTPQSTSSQSQDGYVYTSSERKFVFQSTLDGFTISKQAPYESWQELLDEAHELWDRYEEASQPLGIIRIGVRYINLLRLPLALRDYKDFLTAPPEVPPRLQQTIISFLSRILIPIPKFDSYATITQVSGNPEGSIQPVTLDIDVVKQLKTPASAIESWDMVNNFHEEKNRIFFESITEEMVELCQKD